MSASPPTLPLASAGTALARAPPFAASTLCRLVLAEHHDTIEDAIRREKLLKTWKRAWKIELIEASNPQWRDLWEDIAGA